MATVTVSNAARMFTQTELALLTTPLFSVMTSTADRTVTLDFGAATPTTAEIDAVAVSLGGLSPNQTANAAALKTPATLQARLDRLNAFNTDADLLAVKAQQNNQALPTATLNRALTKMIRREERLTATIALLVRLIDPALLADITDTTDS